MAKTKPTPTEDTVETVETPTKTEEVDGVACVPDIETGALVGMKADPGMSPVLSPNELVTPPDRERLETAVKTQTVTASGFIRRDY